MTVPFLYYNIIVIVAVAVAVVVVVVVVTIAKFIEKVLIISHIF